MLLYNAPLRRLSTGPDSFCRTSAASCCVSEMTSPRTAARVRSGDPIEMQNGRVDLDLDLDHGGTVSPSASDEFSLPTGPSGR